MDESARLARMEAKLDSLMSYLEAKEKSQEKHNDLFYLARDKINELETKQKTAWSVISVIATVCGAIGSYLVSYFKG